MNIDTLEVLDQTLIQGQRAELAIAADWIHVLEIRPTGTFFLQAAAGYTSEGLYLEMPDTSQRVYAHGGLLLKFRQRIGRLVLGPAPTQIKVRLLYGTGLPPGFVSNVMTRPAVMPATWSYTNGTTPITVPSDYKVIVASKADADETWITAVQSTVAIQVHWGDFLGNVGATITPAGQPGVILQNNSTTYPQFLRLPGGPSIAVASLTAATLANVNIYRSTPWVH